MKYKSTIHTFLLTTLGFTTLFLAGCTATEKTTSAKEDPVESNIKAYTQVWDEIMNQGKLEMFNDSNFVADVVMHSRPADVIGIDSMKDYYANFLTGFTDIEFSIKDIFGQGDKLVKYWNFKGKHTGNFFGIPATGKAVDLDGATLVRMSNGKIAEEQDFYDNLDFFTQLGLIPAAQ